MSQDLKPCPFCGHVGLDFSEGSTFRWLAYACGVCGMGSETRIKTSGIGTPEEWRAAAEREAIKEWNTRAQAPAAVPLTGRDAQLLLGDYFTHDRSGARMVCRAIVRHDRDDKGPRTLVEIEPYA